MADQTTRLQEKLRVANKRIEDLEKLLFNQKSYAISSTQPIQEYDKLDGALIESRDTYRKLFNYANDAMFVISLDRENPDFGHFSDVNNFACKSLGYSRVELLQMTPSDITVAEEADSNKRLLTRLYDTGKANLETTYVKKDGTLLPVEIRALRLTINKKDIYMAIARDISDRKTAEKARRESEHLYRLLADNVSDVIWTTDNHLRPQYISPSFNQLTGFPLEMGRDTVHETIIISSPFYQDIQQLLVLTDEKPIHWESEITTSNKKTICVESIATPLPETSNQFSGIIGVTRNISSRKKIMLELEAAKEKELAANAAKSKFLANMSHEVRTPMNGVLGMLQLLTMTNLEEEQLTYVNTAAESGKILLTIINDILDYSKTEAGKLEINPEKFKIRKLIKTIVTSFEGSIDIEAVKLSYNISKNVPKILIADQNRIRQILFNVIGNAVKFTQKGTIKISITCTEKTKNNGLQLLCKIADTGIGIPSDIGDKLFEPFAQIESETHKKIKGTGLGLSIVKQLVTQMHGKVSIRRNSNKGTTVVFTLEVTEGMQYETPKHSKPFIPLLTGPHRRLKTLVVEDETINQQILQAILTKLGHKYKMAKDGEEALAILKTEYFDVILMDVQMPGLDGLETTRIIRSSAQFSHVQSIPIIALTAYAMAGDKEKCLQAGMDSYLSKPVDVKTLEKRLQDLASDSPYQSPTSSPISKPRKKDIKKLPFLSY